ncbi:MAG: type II secretion system ATPase GspE [Candidatus Euphemobacter frigidus]|nr:type II secretion system ATPase GspE [Candidatus Euphemobacter frigidus]MDP8276711.1 type II secretion system ATPase GspE [Candidatus Euphemobacter frigidus]
MIANQSIEEILLADKVVDRAVLDTARSRQEGPDQGKQLGDILFGMGVINQEQYRRALSRHLNLPYLDSLSVEMVDKEIVSRIPLNFLLAHQLIPLKEEKGTVAVAMANPLELQPLDDLRLLLEKEVHPVVCAPDEIIRVANHSYGHADGAAEAMLEGMEEEEITELVTLTDEAEDLLDIATKAPVIKLVNLILFEAVKVRASDIHIEPYEKELRVRYRIDGILYESIKPSKQYQSAITSRVKIMANLNIAEKRLPQDGRIKIKITDREIDLRVSTIPISFGERIVLRLLDRSAQLYSLHDLGMSDDRLALFSRLIKLSHGIILVTGPTGSGKTTTLYAALSNVNSMEQNIITVEDPIEYQIPGIGQIQVKPKIGLTFANGLRSILRQDPDVVLIGEMRDNETAEIAIQASLTGHLVFSTLHTNDAAGAITRLIDMGVEPYLVSSSVVGIMAQRLVRMICPHCRESYHPGEESLREIGLSPDDISEGKLYRGKGCDKCFQSGYMGRSGIFEILLVDEDIRRMILERTNTGEIKKVALKKGMLTLRMDGARKVVEGITTIEEVIRVTQEDIIEA